MQDGFSILSPAGYIMDVSVIAPRNGPGTYGPQYVTPILPGGVVHTRGVGEYALTGSPISGRQGTIVANFITGVAGTAQAVAFVGLSETVALGIALDTSNRPYVVLKDANGTIVGQSAVIGGAISSGTPVRVQLAWNSQGGVYLGSFAGVLVQDAIAGWTVDPLAMWDFIVPTKLYVGTLALGLGQFTGTIVNVQVSNEVIFP